MELLGNQLGFDPGFPGEQHGCFVGNGPVGCVVILLHNHQRRADPNHRPRPNRGTLDAPAVDVFACPADRGITDVYGEVGTGRRTAYQSFGTSFRANALLLDARQAGLATERRGVRQSEITTPPARLGSSGQMSRACLCGYRMAKSAPSAPPTDR